MVSDKPRLAFGLALFALTLLLGFTAFAQTNLGSVTGTILDPANAAIPMADIEVRNVDTGTVFKGGVSNTGNYVIPLPTGKYELTVSAPGFRKYVRQNLEIRVAIDTRVDIKLEIGAVTDVLTVNESAPLLKTESGELSHTVTTEEAESVPVLTTNGGAFFGATKFGNIRNPLAESQLLPGVAFSNDQALVVNGLPSNSETIRIEGQESSGTIWKVGQQGSQGGVDAIQEVTIQTSNFSAEYGLAAGGYFNYIMKSGTNQFHGSGYDYFVNEFLNAGLPFTDAGTVNPDKAGEHIRNSVRRNDYGFTVGGPVMIPKLYNGRDKTFFFFNFEQFRENQFTANGLTTVPTAAYRAGDFGTSGCFSYVPGVGCVFNFGNLTINGAPAMDPLGQTLAFGEIFDPKTTQVVNGYQVRTPFPNQKIPLSRMDPVALNIQSLLPLPNTGGIINNYLIPGYSGFQHTTNPSFKIDHSFSSTIKASLYYSQLYTLNPNTNGFDPVLTGITQTNSKNDTVRLNYEQSIRPTLLLHVGVGFFNQYQPTIPLNFDQTKLGLKGYPNPNQFPSIGSFGDGGGLTNFISGGFVGPGFGAVGPSFTAEIWEQKPTANTSITWVKGNHTYKAGAEYTGEGFPEHSLWRANGSYGFSEAETANPWQNGQPLNFPNGSGFSYASFLLGLPNRLSVTPPTQTRLGNHMVGMYIQDSWKVTRKLTLDYGVRYDYQTYLKEQYGRMQDASFVTPNTSAGGRLGALLYEGTCNCNFSHNYGLAIGPRVGGAYQIDTKTVLRAGAGVQYGVAQTPAGVSYSAADYYVFNESGYGISPLEKTGGLAGGNPYAPGNPFGNAPLVWPNFDQSKYPIANGGLRPPYSPFIYFDHQTRPGRIFTWSIGVQRQVLRDVVVEASYVGNRGAWFAAPLLDATATNSLTPQILASYGLNLNNANDRALLTSQVSSPQVIARFPNLANANAIYPGFPGTQTLAQALRPVPQWNALTTWQGPAKGDSWYDSLQTKVTKRFSHGLQAQGSFTWAKGLVNGTSVDTTYFLPGNPLINDVFNPGQNKQLNQYVAPLATVISFTYTTPKLAATNTGMKIVSYAARDWQLGSLLRYQSGALIAAPNSNNQLMTQLARPGQTFWNVVPGVNPLLVDPNCHCFNPQTTQVLNPAAWVDAPGGQFGTSAPFTSSYRWQRQPAESMSFARSFRMGHEKYNLQLRAEFQNIFNRTFLSAPATGATSPTVALQNTGGVLTGGYGYIATINGAGTQPRTGQLIGRFTF